MQIPSYLLILMASIASAMHFHLGDEVLMKMCAEEAAPMPLEL